MEKKEIFFSLNVNLFGDQMIRYYGENITLIVSTYYFQEKRLTSIHE